jgi:ankyrin repeat protein
MRPDHPQRPPIDEAAAASRRLFNAFCKAAKARRLGDIQALAAQGARIPAAPKGAPSPLAIAVRGSVYSAVLEALLPLGDIHETDEDGRTLLHRAVSAGSAATVETLLAHGADPLRADGLGLTPLMAAAASCHKPCFRLLLPVSDVLARDANGDSALSLAARGLDAQGTLIPGPSMAIVEALLAALPDDAVRAANAEGVTALMQAALHGNAPVAMRLLPLSDAARKSAGGRDAADYARMARQHALAGEIEEEARRQALEADRQALLAEVEKAAPSNAPLAPAPAPRRV